MKKHEAEFTTKVKPWLLEYMGTGAYEIKHTRGEDRFDMREWAEHQRDFLAAAESRHGVCYKIPDDGIAYKPFDVFCLKQEPSWVVIAFPEEFFVIPARKLAAWTEPSITRDDAHLMATVTRRLSDL